MAQVPASNEDQVSPGGRNGEKPSDEKGTGDRAGNPQKANGQDNKPRTAHTGPTIREVKTALGATPPELSFLQRTKLAAAALKCNEDTIRIKVQGDPELRRLYGPSRGQFTPRSPVAPTAAEVIDREEDDLPPHTGESKAGVELLALVSEAERELHLKGLAAQDLDAKTIEKIRNLEGLATSTGAFIVMALENTHRGYYVLVMQLKSVAEDIKKKYLDDPVPGGPDDGTSVKIDAALKPFYYRNFIDAVKAFGDAYNNFLQGAAIILKMGAPADDGKKTKARLGFTGRSARQVNPAPIPSSRAQD